MSLTVVVGGLTGGQFLTGGLGDAPTPTPSSVVVNPDLSVSASVEVVVGSVADWPLTAVNADGSTMVLGSQDKVSARVYARQGQALLFAPPVAWNGATGYLTASVVVSPTSAQTATLAANDDYTLQVWWTSSDGTRTACILRRQLLALDAPGTATQAIPDLVGAEYCRGLIESSIRLTSSQIDAIPNLVTAASDAIRSWCNRRFDQATVIEDTAVELYGQVRLARPPINFIQRVQCYPQVALTISNGTAATSWVYPTATGDLATGQTITGLVLNATNAGATSSQTVTFASLADQQISTLATAINALGGGWSATADPTLGVWPVSELLNTPEGSGASPADLPWAAAQYYVYSENLTTYWPDADDGERTGIYWVGRQNGYGPAARWGPGGEFLFDGPSYGGNWWPNRVKVTYSGGFATVPYEVQLACVELVKNQLDRLATTLILQSETAADYAYTIKPDQVLALPTHVLQGLSRYRLINA